MSADALESLSRDELGALGREYLLAGHMIDRAGMPYAFKEFGLEGMRDIAIEEWMSASPVYTRRIREALRFEGDDVATIFKGMQFDIGAPHQFMDFRFTVHDATHGEFHLAHCGALMDVEPMGEQFVVSMCHHIEDPTFDATAAATNPRARMRPVHRPPRVPADRMPHCNWTVTIEPDAEPLPMPEGAEWLATSRAANVVIERPSGRVDGGGDENYAGPMDPDLRLERFSKATLVVLLDEIALQGHLLSRAYMRAVAKRSDAATAFRLGTHQLVGVAGLTAKRLARFLGTTPDIESIARVLELHPAFRPGAYLDVAIHRHDDAISIELRPCDALAEDDELTWGAVIARNGRDVVNAIARAVDPRAHVTVGSNPFAWEVTIGSAEPTDAQPEEVAVASFSSGATFTFRGPNVPR